VTYPPPPGSQPEPGYQPQQGYQQPPPGYQQPPPGYQQPPPGYPPPPSYQPQPGYQAPPPSGYAGGTGPSAAYANWGQRVGAYLIDQAPIIGGYIVLAILGAILHDVISVILAFVFWIGAIGWFVYNRCIQMGNTGQSLGKRVVGIKLISESTGQPIGAGMAFVRDLCHIVDEIICFVGFLFPLWDAKAQTLADKIVSTVVIPA
jgi:uncharacterized RDD family membrane protein YckC